MSESPLSVQLATLIRLVHELREAQTKNVGACLAAIKNKCDWTLVQSTSEARAAAESAVDRWLAEHAGDAARDREEA